MSKTKHGAEAAGEKNGIKQQQYQFNITVKIKPQPFLSAADAEAL